MITEQIKMNFQRDIAQHQMTVIKDEGFHRHVRFQQPGTIEMYFDLVTWPGHLCYTGDMGTYVFERVTDMFDFFRRPDKSYRIDLRYWAQKVVSSDVGGIARFSMDLFRKKIEHWVNNSDKNDRPQENGPEPLALHEAAYAELRAAVSKDVLQCDENPTRAYDAVTSFEHKGDAWRAAYGPDAVYTFIDFWEVDCTEYTHGFLWCCQALAWSIALYDKKLLEQTAPAVLA